MLIEFTNKGLYCKAGNFFIDPWQPVDKAVITHAHSDHARSGNGSYLCHTLTKPLLELRLGPQSIHAIEWNETVTINGVKVSLHPAGHIIGSSQVRIEHNGEVCVVSGDYKLENDGLSGQFVPIKCHSFITESTFGLPIYNWKPQEEIFSSIQNWILNNHAEGKTSVLMAYSLGKAQRLLPCIEAIGIPIFLHGAVYNIHQALLGTGIKLPAAQRVELDMPKETFKGNVVIAPGSADGSPWMKRFSPYSVGVCSGWMQVRGNVRRRNADAGFVLSDHADWNGLLSAVKDTGAEKVYVTHGFQAAFSRYLNETGLYSAEVKTEYGIDEEELIEPETPVMKQFADLVTILGTSTKTNDKLNALSDYFASANDKDKVWVIALFSGRRPKRTISGSLIQLWCAELVNLPLWLFEESYHTVGDLSETVALLIPDTLTIKNAEPRPLHYYVEKFVELAKADEETRKKFMIQSWRELANPVERFVFNKLLSGAFRIGVSQKLMVNALAKTVKLEPSVIAHRISGNWDPATISFDELLSESVITTDFSKPYPFYLAYALEDEPSSLGEPDEWQAEWKWDGIRGQLIKRNNELFVWSRGEELLTEKFPEYTELKDLLPDGIVLDGEIIPAVDGKPLPFALLQTRIGRKNITKKQLQEVPISFFSYDLLEFEYEDYRNTPLRVRRRKLEEVVASVSHPALQISAIVNFNNWSTLAELRSGSRNQGAEGLMLKKKDSIYQVGRKRGDWWKWKIDPLVIDAVMIYAQKGSGRRSNLYTDYTFAVKDGEKLVSFTKAYSGLTDKEFAEVDAFVKRNSLEKFGPVRTVKPELVFEIAFEGIAASNRHKSGVALRFPRISRWRRDKKPEEINTIGDLKKMLEIYGK